MRQPHLQESGTRGRVETQPPDISQLSIDDSAAPPENSGSAPIQIPSPPPQLASPSPQTGGLVVNINVQAGTGPLTINLIPSSPRVPEVARPGPADDSHAGTRPPVTDIPTSPSPSPQPRTTAARIRYTIRGGGKARVDWVDQLEHIEPNDESYSGKWYVVTAGLRVGIWKSWLDMEDWIDVKGSRYQSCVTYEDAEYRYALAKREARVRQLIK